MSLRDLGAPKSLAALDARYVNETDAAPLALAGQTPSQLPVAPASVAAVGSQAFTARADHAHPSSSLFGWLGDGSDGAATFDGTATPAGVTKVSSTLYKATRDLNYTSIVGSATVTLDMCGYGLFVRGTVAGPGSGTFTISGVPAATSGTNNGTVPSGASTPFANSTQRTVTLGIGQVGKAGTTGVGAINSTYAASGSFLCGGTGAAGGSGSAGAGGAANAPANNTGAPQQLRRFAAATTGVIYAIDAAIANYSANAGFQSGAIQGGLGGSSGSGDSTNVGGAGGTGGAVVIVNALAVTGNVNVTAPGGAGGSPTTGNCGGGGGGGGGVALLNAVDLTGWTGSISAAAGAAGTGIGTGAAGSAGGAGLARATSWA